MYSRLADIDPQIRALHSELTSQAIAANTFVGGWRKSPLILHGPPEVGVNASYTFTAYLCEGCPDAYLVDILLTSRHPAPEGTEYYLISTHYTTDNTRIEVHDIPESLPEWVELLSSIKADHDC